MTRRSPRAGPLYEGRAPVNAPTVIGCRGVGRSAAQRFVEDCLRLCGTGGGKRWNVARFELYAYAEKISERDRFEEERYCRWLAY